MKQVNLENVQEAGSFEKLPAGGYICKYVNVEDIEKKEYLYMEFDIAEYTLSFEFASCTPKLYSGFSMSIR